MPARSLKPPTALSHVAIGYLLPSCQNGSHGGLDIRLLRTSHSHGRAACRSLMQRTTHRSYIALASIHRSGPQRLNDCAIWRRYVEPRELQRIALLEMLDEVEGLRLELVSDHYAISHQQNP